MRNYIFRSLLLALLCCQGTGLLAQTAGPACRTTLNMPVAPNDSVDLVISHLITNADMATPLTIRVMNLYGGTMAMMENAMPDDAIRIHACPYLGRSLSVMLQNNFGACTATVTFKQSNLPVIEGRSQDIYCNDPLAVGGHIGDTLPVAVIPCEPDQEAQLVGDWITTYPCDPDQDTARVIYREYAVTSKAGVRVTSFDTLVLFRLPEISADNVFCGSKDTAYCGISRNHIGPFMLVPGLALNEPCDTLWFLDGNGAPLATDSKCGVQVKVDVQPFPSECEKILKYTVQIKQSCFDDMTTSCPMNTDEANTLESLGAGYWRCTFWQVELDTVPPDVDCGPDIQVLPTGTHNCETMIALPPVLASDFCHDVVMVKAIIEDYGTYMFTRENGFWTSDETVRLALVEDTVKVIYEAFDACHNVGYDSCAFIIQDRTKPIAVSEKRLNISVGSKEAWVEAESFNLESWDNCEISQILVRRKDWLQASLDLCSQLEAYQVLPGGADTIWQSVLSTDPQDKVAAHYLQTLQWLETDGGPCTDLLREAWRYALLKHGTVTCKGVMSASDFDIFIEPMLDPNLDPVDIVQLGGGWSPKVPLFCEDVCQVVTVELLVMDYWCNWSTGWTEVWVEDKSAVQTFQDIADVDITCKSLRDLRYTYADLPASIESLATAAAAGDADAMEALDAIFGTYEKGWLNDQGMLVDEVGVPLDLNLTFIDSSCVCIDTTETELMFTDDEGWIEAEVDARYCYYIGEAINVQQGAFIVNCPDNVFMEQDVWVDLDECGQGSIKRTWRIWKACQTGDAFGEVEEVDTIVKSQTIYIGGDCELDPGMFTYPADTEVETCILEYDPNGSGNVAGSAHPDSTGRPEFIFDDDCRLVGIGYFDKVLNTVNDTNYCHKIIRTWCFADWCATEQPLDDGWIGDPDFEGTEFKYIQKILVRCTCTCMLDCTSLRDTSIACDDIPADVTDLYSLFNTPEIFHPDPMMTCDEFSLEDTTVVDTNACGIGTLTRTWYLLDEEMIRTDSCSETITLVGDDFEIRAGESYEGNAEPTTCNAVITMNPIEISGACAKLGDFTITYNSIMGNNASGTYPVGDSIIQYTISNDNGCLADILVYDTVLVIDDVRPGISTLGDPCVSLTEWNDLYNNDPLDSTLLTIVQVIDNCPDPTADLLNLTSDTVFQIDGISIDTILFIYRWQGVDASGNRSNVLVDTILVSNDCNGTQALMHGVEYGDKVKSHESTDRDMISGRYNSKPSGLGNSYDYELHQNQPNPFREGTVIGFTIPETAPVTLRVYDVTGRMIKEISQTFSRGHHQINLDKTDLPTSGILYYRMDTDAYTATRKMMLID